MRIPVVSGSARGLCLALAGAAMLVASGPAMAGQATETAAPATSATAPAPDAAAQPRQPAAAEAKPSVVAAESTREMRSAAVQRTAATPLPPRRKLVRRAVHRMHVAYPPFLRAPLFRVSYLVERPYVLMLGVGF